MAIKAKNIIVGGVKPPPTEIPSKSPKLKDIKEHIKKELEKTINKKPKKDLSKVDLQPQTTKQLPKYIAKEEGELTRKINTKSQYMRDIFDLDS